MAETKAVVRKDMPAELVGLRPAGVYTFDELYRLAQVCHASGMFKDTADAAQAMIKIVRGQEMGLPPTTAMMAFDIIKDRLFIKPWAIAAKINSCGYGTYRVIMQTPEECSIAFKRRYPVEGWVALPLISYTIAEAKAHGLVERSPHWKANPAHMLYQRAMGRGGSMYFPELLAGLEAPPDDTPIPAERHRQNIVELFGDTQGSPNDVSHARDAARDETLSNKATGGTGGRGEQNSEAPAGQKQAHAPEPSWKLTLRAHRDTIAQMVVSGAHEEDQRAKLDDLLESIDFALSPLGTVTDTQGFNLASAVLEWVDQAKEG